jgi:hypothetical protein
VERYAFQAVAVLLLIQALRVWLSACPWPLAVLFLVSALVAAPFLFIAARG